MSEDCTEDDFVALFTKLNVRTGKLTPRAIKAWFDTDCEELLKWMCSSITEECYVTPQEDFEYSQLDNKLNGEKLDGKVQQIELRYPDLFNLESNTTIINSAKNTIEVLEEELEDYNRQLKLNKQLEQQLSDEYLKVLSEEMTVQEESEAAQQKCLRLCRELDNTNSTIYGQLARYNFILRNYEFGGDPKFINNCDTEGFEEELNDIVNSLHSVAKVEGRLSEVSQKGVNDTLLELENRIFYARLGRLNLQMELEGLNCAYECLENFDINSLPSIDRNFLQYHVKENQSQQSYLENKKLIEDLSATYAQQCVAQPSLRRLKKTLDFHLSKVNYLNSFNENLMWISINLVMLCHLHTQEKRDIKDSVQFFKTVRKYVSNDLECNSRKEAMSKVIEDYETFSSQPIEKQLKIISDISGIFSKEEATLEETLREAVTLRKTTKQLKTNLLNPPEEFNTNMLITQKNIATMKRFLISGPSSRIIVIPYHLQMLLLKVDQTLGNLQTAVKLLARAAREPKERLSRDRWLRYRNKLWVYFMTDPTKLKQVLCRFSEEQNPNNTCLTFKEFTQLM